MVRDADAGELARLDKKIAKDDADGSPEAAWRAAWAVFDKAELSERVQGPDAALELYADVARRLEDPPDDDQRVLLVYAINNVSRLHQQCGREADSRSIAEKVLEQHFDDAPTDAAEAVVDAALRLAWLLDQAGEHDRVLGLTERLIERYAQPEMPDARRTKARADCAAGWALHATGRFEAALSRFEGGLRELGNAADSDLRPIVAHALLGKAAVLSKMERDAECAAVCEEVIARFGGDDDPEIAEQVARARSRSQLTRAWLLHGRIGRAREAERAWRDSIEAGAVDAWLNLGHVLSGVPGRRADEEQAFRMALGSDDPEIASLAGLKLGNITYHFNRNLEEARVCYELAAERGSGITAAHGSIGLGFLLAEQGDREAAREHLRTGMILLGEAKCGLDISDSVDRPARTYSVIASSRFSKGLWRRYRAAAYWAPRPFRALVRSSRPARWIADVADRAGRA